MTFFPDQISHAFQRASHIGMFSSQSFFLNSQGTFQHRFSGSEIAFREIDFTQTIESLGYIGGVGTESRLRKSQLFLGQDLCILVLSLLEESFSLRIKVLPVCAPCVRANGRRKGNGQNQENRSSARAGHRASPPSRPLRGVNV